MNKYSRNILYSVICLCVFGLIMIYSSSYISTEEDSKFLSGFMMIKRQILWFILSIMVLTFFYLFDYRKLQKYYWVAYLISILLLIALLIPSLSSSSNGARRWIRMGVFNVQPSEFAKMAIIIGLAGFIAKNPVKLRFFKQGFLPVISSIILMMMLVIVEPDIGAAFFIGFTSICILFLSNINLKHIIPFILITVPIGMYSVVKIFHHAQERIAVFLNPNSDPLGKGHQIIQSLIGIGSGGIFGKGLGMSVQKLFYLPEEFTDFIFVIIAEELGFVGSIFLLAIFFYLIYNCYKLTLETDNHFGFLVAAGITILIAIQFLVNIAVVTACMPTKGVALPFISFGGSSLFFLMAGIGIIMNIGKQNSKMKAETMSSH